LAQTRFSTLVVDEEGLPLPEVSVTGLREGSRADGRVEGASTLSRLVFRKQEYSAVVAAPATGMVVILRSAPPPPFPRCRTRSALGTMFSLPSAKRVLRFQDSDFSGTSYVLQTKTGKYTIDHGHGPNWSHGVPSVWFLSNAATYEETSFNSGIPGSLNITTACGVLTDGTHWRFLGKYGETISYQTKDAEAAAKLDTIFDTVCLQR
jgi:hypothetical protein